MGTFEYNKWIAELDGRKGPELPEGVTHVTKRFEGKDNQWDATVYFKDGRPFYTTFFIWSVSDENVKKGLQEMMGEGFKLGTCGGGQGHMHATIVPVTDDEEAPKP